MSKPINNEISLASFLIMVSMLIFHSSCCIDCTSGISVSLQMMTNKKTKVKIQTCYKEFVRGVPNMFCNIETKL